MKWGTSLHEFAHQTLCPLMLFGFPTSSALFPGGWCCCSLGPGIHPILQVLLEKSSYCPSALQFPDEMGGWSAGSWGTMLDNRVVDTGRTFKCKMKMKFKCKMRIWGQILIRDTSEWQTSCRKESAQHYCGVDHSTSSSPLVMKNPVWGIWKNSKCQPNKQTEN